MMFLLKYWRAILFAAIVAGAMGYVWHLSSENTRLTHENEVVTASYLANKKTLEELEADKAKTEEILTKNSEANQAAQRENNKLRTKLKELMEKSDEESRKCYSTDIDKSTNDWLQQNSNKDRD